MSRIKFVKKIWEYMHQYKLRFFVSYIVITIELICTQISPLFLGKVIDAAVYQSNMHLFLHNTIIYALCFCIQQIAIFLQLQLWQLLNNKFIYDLRIQCFNKILNLKAKKLFNINTGDVIKSINDDTSDIQHIIQRNMMRTINAVIGSIVSVVIVFFIQWHVAVFVIISVSFSVILANRITMQISKIAKSNREKQGQYSSWVLEILKGLKEIKFFAAENHLVKIFDTKSRELFQSSMTQEIVTLKLEQAIDITYFISRTLFYIICALTCLNGTMNVAEYMSVVSYYILITSNFQRILRDNIQFQTRQVAIERVFDILESEYEEEKGLEALSVTEGKIHINNLSFSYADIENLKNINYTIEGGKKVAIVGYSGEGKSTLAHLLVKILDPSKGKILIDGQDIAQCTYSSIRQSIGILSQEITIFEGTIKDNICLGENVPDKKVWDILEKAQLKEEIMRLPQGLATVIGGKECQMSGGQNQRLTIARLLYKSPQIIILDEATSALDVETETKVQEALNELSVGRTTIVISHRLSSVINAEEILVLREGEIVAHGTFDELISSNTTFKQLFCKQAEKKEEISNET